MRANCASGTRHGYALHDDGSVTVAAALGGYHQGEGQDPPGNQIGVDTIEAAVADLLALVRTSSENIATGDFDLRISIEWGGDDLMHFKVPGGGAGSTTTLSAYTPIYPTISNASGPDEFYDSVYETICDAVKPAAWTSSAAPRCRGRLTRRRRRREVGPIGELRAPTVAVSTLHKHLGLERTLLGYRGHPEWRDMSEYAVHFTKDPNGNGDGYWSMLSILSDGRLNPGGPFGVAAEHDFLADSQKSVCMSEIPLDQLARVVEHRSKYGIAFTHSVLVTKGGARVWYVDEPSPLAESWRALVAEQGALQEAHANIWRMTPFVDLPSESAWFSHYEWEREWRVPEGMSFAPSEVAFLFVPEALHSAARAFFVEKAADGSGPSYACPLLDAAWPEDRLQEAFAQVAL